MFGRKRPMSERVMRLSDGTYLYASDDLGAREYARKKSEEDMANDEVTARTTDTNSLAHRRLEQVTKDAIAPLRDELAKAAMTTLISRMGVSGSLGWEMIARDAYALADAMLKARG